MIRDTSVSVEVYEYGSSAWAIVGGSLIAGVIWGFVLIAVVSYNASYVNLATRLENIQKFGAGYDLDPPDGVAATAHVTQVQISLLLL